MCKIFKGSTFNKGDFRGEVCLILLEFLNRKRNIRMNTRTRNSVPASVLLAALCLASACSTEAVKGEEVTRDRTVAAAQPTPMPTNKEPITIAAVGDMMIGSTYPDETRLPPNEGADVLKDVTPLLSAADIAFGNLEGPIIDGGMTGKCSPGSTKCFAFKTPTRYAKNYKAAGFDVVSVANNHAGDFGEPGRISTQRALDEQGIKYAGSLQPRAVIAYLEVKGKRVAFVAFGHNNGMPTTKDLAGARELVMEADKKADIVVVSFHGGAEGTGAQHVPNATEMFLGENRGNLPAFAKTVIDAGADLVLGHGPHVQRGMEIYKDRLIAYSMGNFATYGWFQLAAETAMSMVLEVKLQPDGRFAGGKLHSVKLEGKGVPMLDKTGASIRLVRDLSNADFGPNAPKIADDGTISAK